MDLDIGYSTDPGPREGPNQDAFLIVTSEEHEEVSLFVVADGMGGAQAGDFASRRAVEVIHEHLLEGANLTIGSAADRLREAIKAANISIYEQAQTSPELKGMGCTVVAVLAMEDLYWVASVGDSRVYLVRDNAYTQLTEDHTWVNARVREGILTPEQAENHQLKHVLDRALGTRPTVEVDIRLDEIFEEGDVLILCTDGLYGVLADAVIVEAANIDNAQAAADWLLEQALAAPARDNTTVVVLRVNNLF